MVDTLQCYTRLLVVEKGLFIVTFIDEPQFSKLDRVLTICDLHHGGKTSEGSVDA